MFFLTFPWDWSFLSLACILVSFWVFRRRERSIPKGLRLPPGPPGRFLVGNLPDLPTHHEYNSREGDLVLIKVPNTRIIYVNSSEVARELFEKRSSLYSDRFHSPMIHDLMGSDWLMPFIPYGEKWRRRRRAFTQQFHQAAFILHRDIQAKQTRAFLKRLQESPNKFMEHIRHLSGAIIVEIIYGMQVLPEGDPYIESAERVMAAFAEAANPGAFLVDTFPILKHVPAWMPGAGFRRKAHACKVKTREMAVMPFGLVKKSLAAGTAKPSFLTSLLEDLASRTDTPSDEEDVVCDAAGVAYFGGADTTVSAIKTFSLAMVLYPEIQQKAQEEIDALIGDRFPDFEDRDELPFVNAMCKEVLRWHPVVPLGVAHKVTQDDVYGEYFIPGGTIIVGNSWGMLRDEKDFGPETDKFKPERFLVPGVKEPSFAFGFGRRICPGRTTAENSIFIAVLSILKVFNITHAKDGDGNDIPVKDAYSSGFLSHPEPFQCSITLRPGSKDLLF